MAGAIGKMLCTLLALGLLASDAAAEPYTILPNGDLVFNVDVTTTGTLSCTALITCTSSAPNAVTLWSDGGSATFTFTGTNASAAVGNVTVPMDLGSIVGSSSPGFSFPSGTNPNGNLFVFLFRLTQTSPIQSTSSVVWGFGVDLSRFGGGSYFQTLAGPNPPGYQYPLIIYTLRPSAMELSMNGTTELIADVGAVPEPASAVLLATGLLGLAARQRTRRSRPVSE